MKAQQAGVFRRKYNKKLPCRSCNRRILPTDESKPEVPMSIAPAPLVRFLTAPAPDHALTSSILVPAEANLSYFTKHYRKRKLEAEQAAEVLKKCPSHKQDIQ
ncbi:hypothetical protein DPMN_024930 [Dreissena polymorpha]|uniref:Uncharacterized protein n=1 Tax=Dreissena polymorpha TaxID=45954 RepID=A0A9D4RCU5_DREPO|nr:hypothetical protein DPMN_024930 [Dreissena polymorpha]